MPPNGKLKWQSPPLRKVRSGYAKLRHFCFCSKVQRALKGKCVPGRGEQVLLLYLFLYHRRFFFFTLWLYSTEHTLMLLQYRYR